MVNYLKIKKRYIFIFLLLISNQFLSKGYTSNNRKLFKDELHKNTNLLKYNQSLSTLPYEQFKNKFYNNFQYKKIYNLNTLKFLAQNEILNQESEQTKNKDQDYKKNAISEEQNNKSFYEYLKNKYITNTDKNIDAKSIEYNEKSNFEKLENESFYKDLKNNYTTNINTKDKGKSLFTSILTSSASVVISLSLVLFFIGMLALVLINAQKLSNYVKENIGFTIIQ